MLRNVSFSPTFFACEIYYHNVCTLPYCNSVAMARTTVLIVYFYTDLGPIYRTNNSLLQSKDFNVVTSLNANTPAIRGNNCRA